MKTNPIFDIMSKIGKKTLKNSASHKLL